MKRLTRRNGNHTYFSNYGCSLCVYEKENHSTFCENISCASAKDRSCPYLQVIDRLADYEDTGLTPNEIAKLVKIKKLVEKVKELE